MISLISSFEIVNGDCFAKSEGHVIDPKIFLWMGASVADVAAVNRNSIITLLANNLSTVFVKGNPSFSNGYKSLSKNRPDCPISCNRVFDNFILADEPFAKASWSLKTCILVNDSVWEKLFSSLESPTTYDKSSKNTFYSIFYFIKLRIRQFYVESVIFSHFILKLISIFS